MSVSLGALARGGTAPVGTTTELLARFFVEAVGLRLLGPTEEIGANRAKLVPQRAPVRCEPAVWVAWMTDAGPLCAWGAYEHGQSQELHVHVLFIEWWLPPNTHHMGWWRCNPKRPGEWTVGRGG
jgi:hypothetical protein